MTTEPSPFNAAKAPLLRLSCLVLFCEPMAGIAVRRKSVADFVDVAVMAIDPSARDESSETV